MFHSSDGILRLQISVTSPPFFTAMFSKALANAARFSALFAIMRYILAHIGTTNPRLEETPRITPVDCKSRIAVFRYCWKIQRVVADKVVPFSPVSKSTPFNGRQSSTKGCIQWAEKKHDDTMRQIRRYYAQKLRV